jgi:hypothetical protein
MGIKKIAPPGEESLGVYKLRCLALSEGGGAVCTRLRRGK